MVGNCILESIWHICITLYISTHTSFKKNIHTLFKPSIINFTIFTQTLSSSMSGKRIALLVFVSMVFVLTTMVKTVLCLPQEADLLHEQYQPTFNDLIQKIETEQESNTQQALTDSKQALQQAQNSRNNNWLLQAYYETGKTYYLLGYLDSCYYYATKSLALNIPNDTITADIYNRLIILERNYGHYEKAVQMGNRALELYRKTGDSAGVAEAMLNRANIYRIQGKFKYALNDLFTVLNIYELQHDSSHISRTMGNVGNLYMDIGKPEKAKMYLLEAIKYAAFLGYDTRYADPLNNYGALVYDEQKYDSAYFYFDSAKRIYEKTGKPDAIATGYENVGVTQVYLNQKEQGFKNLHHAYRMFDSLKLIKDKIYVLLDLGSAFEKTGNNDSVLYYYLKSYELSKAIGYNYGKKLSLFNLYQTTKNTGNYKSSLKWHELYTKLKDSLESENLQENLQELEAKYQTVKQEKTILELREKELIEKSRRRLLLSLLFIIISLVLFLALFFWLKRKKDVEINLQKMLALKQEKNLIEAQIAQKELEAEKLQNDIEFKTRQLAGHALNMMQKNKLLQSISTDIKTRLNSAGCTDKEAMKNILRNVQQGLNLDKDWDLFKIYFEQINERFFDKLKEVNPALTGNDFRLCALIKLNLSIKEMASVLNISPDSLKNARYRLKKKLHLSSDESLSVFINSL